jgi:hypothetical protein
MRSILASIAVLAITLPIFAVAPQFWTVATPDDFLGGELEGFMVTARGSLQNGPSVTRVTSVTDPFVLSQAVGDDGTRYLGTGNSGKVYRLSGSDLKPLYTAPEPEIYAMVFARGSLFVASSPNGKIYRVDPKSGAATEFYDPKEAYIWALALLPDGSIAAATGVEGRLHHVRPNGQGRVWYDAPETHLRSIAAGRPGTVLVGGSGEGRIYEISDAGGRALFDSPLPEISTIYYDASRNQGWAAGVTNVLPTAAPAKTDAAKTTSAQQSSGSGSERQQQASATVDVSFSFEETPSAGPAPTGSAELYRISSDGFVEPVRKFERELIYAITGGPDDSIYIATGPQGRIYQYRAGEFALIASVPDKQVVSFGRDGNNLYATTTNSGAVYRLGTGQSKGEFRSTVRDTGRFSNFGQYRIQGKTIPNGTTVSFRSGNTSTPDDTWSSWSAPQNGSNGRVNAPPARYLQMRLAGSGDLSIDSISVAYVNRNVAPVIESLTVAEPGVVFLSGTYPTAPQVVEATNPDEYGIFTSLDEPTDRSGSAGKRYFRRGYRTVSWKASDANGDLLRYNVHFRRVGSSEWLRLRENVDETQFNFDTSQLPDGRYEIRVVASDIRSNPEGALTDTREGVEMLVDNTPPRISTSSSGDQIVVRISDDLSPIGKAEYSVDAQKWLPLIPEDGISDSMEETYRIPRPKSGGRFVVIRAVDSHFNVATASVQ